MSLFSLFDPSASCIAVTGGGGKTSLLKSLAALLMEEGRNVISTTTRTLLPGPDNPLHAYALVLLQGQSLPRLAGTLRDYFQSDPLARHLALGKRIVPHPDKVTGLPPEVLRKLMELLASSLPGNPPCFLVEADGAAGLPLKAHAAHEPVIPECSDFVIAVAGLDALGQPLQAIAHRPEMAAQRLGLSPLEPNPIVTPDHMATLLLHPLGPFRGISRFGRPVRRAIFLNKMDDAGKAADASAVIRALRRIDPGIPCHVGSLRQGWSELAA